MERVPVSLPRPRLDGTRMTPLSFSSSIVLRKNVSSFSSEFESYQNFSFSSSTFGSSKNVSSFSRSPSSSMFESCKNDSSCSTSTVPTLRSPSAMPLKKVSDSVAVSLSPLKRDGSSSFFLSTLSRKMTQFSTLEATSTGEKVVNMDKLWSMGKLWSITAFVRSTSWLISPASVETITLQLQSDLFVVFGAVAFATLLVSEHTFAKTLSPFTMILPRSLFALLETFQNAGQFCFFERHVLVS